MFMNINFINLADDVVVGFLFIFISFIILMYFISEYDLKKLNNKKEENIK